MSARVWMRFGSAAECERRAFLSLGLLAGRTPTSRGGAVPVATIRGDASVCPQPDGVDRPDESC